VGIPVPQFEAFAKEANVLSSTGGFLRAAIGTEARTAKAQMETAKKALDRAVERYGPKAMGGGVRMGRTEVGTVAPRIKMPANPAAQEVGRRVIAERASGYGTARARHAEAAQATRTARKNLAIGAGGAVLGAGGTAASIHAIKRRLGSREPIKPQQPKVAAIGMTSDADRRRRHAYYVAHRNQMLQKSRAYRMTNRAVLSRKKKKYRRQVEMGVRKQRRRLDVGGHGYAYGGFR